MASSKLDIFLKDFLHFNKGNYKELYRKFILLTPD